MAQAETHRFGFHLKTRALTGVHWITIGLAAITGVVHLYLYWSQEFLPFLLAGLGFYAAIVLVLLDFYRRLVYVVGIPYTLAQMLGWVAAGMPDFALGVFDKAVQTVLIVLLIYLFFSETRERRRVASGEEAEPAE